MYEQRPRSREDSLDEQEVLALIEQPKTLARDPDLIVRVMSRVLLTLRRRDREVADLRKSLEQLNESRSSSNHPVSRGLEAINELSEEQLEQVLGAHLRSKLALTEKAEQEAQRARTAARSELNRVRFVLAKLVSDGSLGETGRTRVRAALDSLAKVEVPEELKQWAFSDQGLKKVHEPAPVPRHLPAGAPATLATPPVSRVELEEPQVPESPDDGDGLADLFKE